MSNDKSGEWKIWLIRLTAFVLGGFAITVLLGGAFGMKGFDVMIYFLCAIYLLMVLAFLLFRPIKNTTDKDELVEWIVNDIGELGVKVDGRCLFLYKGYCIEYEPSDETQFYRETYKREFGEVCRPVNYWDESGHIVLKNFKDSAPESMWRKLPNPPKTEKHT